MPLPPERQAEVNAEVRAIIRRSNLWSPTDSPETVAALMVLHVCRHLGVPHERIPETLLGALAGIGSDDTSR